MKTPVWVTTVEVTQTIVFSHLSLMKLRSWIRQTPSKCFWSRNFWVCFHRTFREMNRWDFFEKSCSSRSKLWIFRCKEKLYWDTKKKRAWRSPFYDILYEKNIIEKKHDKENWWKKKEAEKDLKTKAIVELDSRLACSIKGVVVKQNNAVKPTTRLFSGKVLMFAKISLISFIYDMIETFCFPNT